MKVLQVPCSCCKGTGHVDLFPSFMHLWVWLLKNPMVTAVEAHEAYARQFFRSQSNTDAAMKRLVHFGLASRFESVENKRKCVRYQGKKPALGGGRRMATKVEG
jgi:hypothetical protein